jgi:hypothetical protein
MSHSAEMNTAKPPSLSIVLMSAGTPEPEVRSRAEALVSWLSGAVEELEVLIIGQGTAGEQDGSAPALDRWASTQDRVRVLNHPQHGDPGPALHTGLTYARLGHALVVPAGSPAVREDLLEYIHAAEGADIVVGRREGRAHTSLVERAIASGVRALLSLPVAPFQLTCLYRTRVLNEIWIEYDRSPFIVPEIAVKARDRGARLVELVVASAQSLPIQPVTSVAYDAAHFWMRRLTSREHKE